MALYLPQELREQFKKPFGRLYRGDGNAPIESLKQDLRNMSKAISVGDVVTFYLIKSGKIPDVCVVDEKIMRKVAPKELILGTKMQEFMQMSVDNPAGQITKELVLALNEAIECNRPTRIFVCGEEDLAALPAVIIAPLYSAIIYGQPGEGVVLVTVDEEKKYEAVSLLRQMKGDSLCSLLEEMMKSNQGRQL